MIEDLRDFIAACEQHGVLHRIPVEVDWDLELSHITVLNEERKGPALLFERTKDSDIPVLTSAFTTSERMALCLEQDPKMSLCDLSKTWMERLKRGEVPPQIVKEVPVAQNVISDDDVDLTRFPSPRFYPEDGGRYIGTAHYLVCKDPDTGWINLGTYRMQLQGKNVASVMIARGKHAEMIYRKYAERGQRMPVAVVIGCDPLHFLVSSTQIGAGVSEYDVIGALRQKPVPVFESDLTGLLLPAKAEIILEGYLDLDDRRPEGPLGEYTGYYSSAKDIKGGAGLEPTIKVQRILHRDNPIFWASTVGKPVNDCHMIQAISRSAMLWHELETRKIPGIQAVYVLPESGGWCWAVISLRQMYPGHSNQVGLTAIGFYGLKGVILVDHDIPVDNWTRVWWALSARFDPCRSIQIINRGRASPLDPSFRDNRYIMSMVIMDATTPFEWEQKPREVFMDRETLGRVAQRWNQYGFADARPSAPVLDRLSGK